MIAPLAPHRRRHRRHRRPSMIPEVAIFRLRSRKTRMNGRLSKHGHPSCAITRVVTATALSRPTWPTFSWRFRAVKCDVIDLFYCIILYLIVLKWICLEFRSLISLIKLFFLCLLGSFK